MLKRPGSGRNSQLRRKMSEMGMKSEVIGKGLLQRVLEESWISFSIKRSETCLMALLRRSRSSFAIAMPYTLDLSTDWAAVKGKDRLKIVRMGRRDE